MREVVQIRCVGLRTHSVRNGVGVRVGDPGHFPLSCAHVWSRDVDARSCGGGGGGRRGGELTKHGSHNAGIKIKKTERKPNVCNKIRRGGGITKKEGLLN